REPRARERVRDRRERPADHEPAMDPPERVVRARTQMMVIVMREELRAIRRHVDAGRTLLLARLARETQVHRFAHGVAAPAVVDGVAEHHLVEEMSAAARRVTLLDRDHVARA